MYTFGYLHLMYLPIDLLYIYLSFLLQSTKGKYFTKFEFYLPLKTNN
jgi:hypothetical protein